MSIMTCPKCEAYVDTDYHDYDFDNNQCIECFCEGDEE